MGYKGHKNQGPERSKTVMNHRLPLALIACAVVGLTLPAQAQRGANSADEEAEFLDREPEDCIRTSRIRNTEIIDDETILFYMRGSRVYRNALDHACPGLERSGRFIMETRNGQLCSIDTVTSFRQFGSTFFPGATCMLGPFHPITREEAELMELELDESAEVQGSVVMTPVDPDVVADEESAEDDVPVETEDE